MVSNEKLLCKQGLSILLNTNLVVAAPIRYLRKGARRHRQSVCYLSRPQSALITQSPWGDRPRSKISPCARSRQVICTLACPLGDLCLRTGR